MCQFTGVATWFRSTKSRATIASFSRERMAYGVLSQSPTNYMYKTNNTYRLLLQLQIQKLRMPSKLDVKSSDCSREDSPLEI
jgi:hypothetical protein